MTFYFPHNRPWHYQKKSSLWNWIEHSPFKLIMNWAYRLWQGNAFSLANKLHGSNNYDLCHLITYVGFRFPGRFYQLSCPFVWGPVGGLENTPKHFLPLLGMYGAIYYSFRNLINTWDKKYLEHPQKAFAKAAATNSIIAATTGIRQEIEKWYGVESRVVCEIGPPPFERMVAVNERLDHDPLQLCWSGEHLPGKALPLLLRALARLPENMRWFLHVLGEGPCSSFWKKLANSLGLQARCVFHGLVPREQALEVMASSHVFVITSLKDLTSSVLLEAMTLGKPVIAPDHCGFSDVITRECGVKIPITDIGCFVEGLRRAIERMWDEPLRQQLGEGASRRICQYSWENKVCALNEIYEGCCSGE
ncbi:glycosyltransferase [Desulfobulbus rhabdoformis]|uniref:glycosyltransferase n=1 Tax=Desulfobulbus rhabdoformis TaxID=34032 RepID=UPI001965A814|nr:glycosyltransferase [Desulfobulbus rhabdoformis]MBM9612695.1 glycosyltransferase [Desulfobulbus rhabdoformis]